MISSLCKDPFRLFFPVSLLMAIYACSIWIGFVFYSKGTYPGMLHAQLFVGGFLYFSILGFLLTALPRFTQTDFLSPKELMLFALVIIGVLYGSLMGNPKVMWTAILLGWPLLIQFAILRFLHRKHNPPYTFLFVGLGLLFGLVGSAILCLDKWISLSVGGLAVGKILFYDAMVLSLIIGVGGRLIPGILGFKEIVNYQRGIYEKPLPFLKIVPREIFLLASLFLLSFAFEALALFQLGWVLRALVIVYVSIKYWNIYKNPSEKKYHGLFLRISCGFIVVGSLLLAIFPQYALGIKHLVYIGGYSLLTFLVASRVILAHGSSGLALEYKMIPYVSFGTMFIIAAITRSSAELLPANFMSHLGYAGASFLVATLIWGVIFLPKLLILKRQ